MRHRLQLGDFSEVKIIREKFGPERPAELDELAIHRWFLWEIAIANFDFRMCQFTNTSQSFQTAPAPRAPDRVARIGDVLQFLQNKPRNDDCAFDKIALQQIGNTPI